LKKKEKYAQEVTKNLLANI